MAGFLRCQSWDPALSVLNLEKWLAFCALRAGTLRSPPLNHKKFFAFCAEIALGAAALPSVLKSEKILTVCSDRALGAGTLP